MLLPLALMALGYTAFFVTLLLARVTSEILGARLRALRLQRVQAAEA
jgi:hypothetical protein